MEKDEAELNTTRTFVKAVPAADLIFYVTLLRYRQHGASASGEQRDCDIHTTQTRLGRVLLEVRKE